MTNHRRFTVKQQPQLPMPMRLPIIASLNRINKLFLATVLGLNGANIYLGSQTLAAEVPRPVQSQIAAPSASVLAQNLAKRKRIIFHLPDRSVPGSRVPGGTRSICFANSPQLPLTAITPLTEDGLKNAEVPALSDRPVFWIYLPPTLVDEAEFSLVENNSAQTVVYQKSMKLVNSGGMARITLPEDDTIRLKVNHSYLWTFSFLCDPEDPSNLFSVGGGLRRVEASSGFERQLQTSSSEDLPRLYAERGYWLEAVDTLLQLRQQRPQDMNLLQDWTNLLTAVKLDSLVHEPLLTYWSAEKKP